METQRFTFRQQEFARLYASGYPAYRAAIYAGYARSTAETNAARLLANPAVQAYIQAHRSYHLPNHPDDQEAELARLRHIIRYSHDDKIAVMALREKRIRAKDARRIQATTSLPKEQAEQLMPTTSVLTDVEPVSNQITKGKRVTKNTILQTSKPAPLAVQEQDHLPDGRPAYDVRLKATPALPPTEEQNIPVQFFPTTGPYHPTPDPDLSNTP